MCVSLKSIINYVGSIIKVFLIAEQDYQWENSSQGKCSLSFDRESWLNFFFDFSNVGNI